ncbi:MAG: hypothetical protein EZS28_007726 [Streblomastix strix]|uniref:Uncharacterized protein n=1 Tax=Streblomastix strix TaxID=222440 RepID=A0A5J4WPI6_9EUKA|nr:MAG: hypothetical protein EZS28_007726 [Streblomastix strix]
MRNRRRHHRHNESSSEDEFIDQNSSSDDGTGCLQGNCSSQRAFKRFIRIFLGTQINGFLLTQGDDISFLTMLYREQMQRDVEVQIAAMGQMNEQQNQGWFGMLRRDRTSVRADVNNVNRPSNTTNNQPQTPVFANVDANARTNNQREDINGLNNNQLGWVILEQTGSGVWDGIDESIAEQGARGVIFNVIRQLANREHRDKVVQQQNRQNITNRRQNDEMVEEGNIRNRIFERVGLDRNRTMFQNEQNENTEEDEELKKMFKLINVDPNFLPRIVIVNDPDTTLSTGTSTALIGLFSKGIN